MKKFSKILETNYNDITEDPKDSLNRIINYLSDCGEKDAFEQEVSDILDAKQREEENDLRKWNNSSDGGIPLSNYRFREPEIFTDGIYNYHLSSGSFLDDMSQISSFKELKEIIIRYDIYEESTTFIYFHLMVLHDFYEKLPSTGSYMKKINRS
tara:strand:+ start:66242 stop:66703 length:462 start_codon:yes stop_codon:yes gene_type:complete